MLAIFIRKFAVCSALIALVIFVSACANNNSGGGSSGQINVAGNWKFVFASSRGTGGSGSGALMQSGNTFSGTLALSGTVCASSAPISGTVSGNNLTAVLTENGQVVNLS